MYIDPSEEVIISPSDDGKPVYQEKSEERAKIAADTEIYLANGGVIYQATSKDNSGHTTIIPRTRKQMIENQKAQYSKAMARRIERKAASQR